MIRQPILYIFLFLTTALSAQEQLGLKLNNYGGVNTIFLNPANGVNSPFAWDVNIVGADIFIENNYAFFESTRLFELAGQLENEIEVRPNIDNESEIGPNAPILDFFTQPKKRFAAVAVNVTGPSVLVQLSNQQAIGLFTRLRTATYAQKVPNSLSFYEFESKNVFESFSVVPFQATAAVWGELGIHYSKSFTTYTGKAALGINIKYLQGYEAAYLNSKSTLRLTRLPNDSLETNLADLEYAFTNSNTTGEDFERSRNGSGFSIDIGYSFTIEEYEDEYRWRIGVALQDIGRLSFNRNAERYQLISEEPVQVWGDDYERFKGLDQFDELIDFFNRDVLGDSLITNVFNPSFQIWLPAALSLQVDYAVNENIYLNTTYIQRITPPGVALERGNLIALTPRFESRWFTAAVPLAMYNWQDFRFGLALRLGFLTIGSDNLGSMLRRTDFTGTDFYVALKVNPFKTNFGGKSKRKRGKVVCPVISR